MDKKRLTKIIKAIFLILAAFFLIQYLKNNFSDIQEMNIKIDWWIFFLSMLLYFIYKITLASLWHYITKLNNCAIKYSNAITGYLYSILGKYIPGKVFMLAARIPSYQEEGVPPRKVTICFFIENVCTLLGAAFLFILSLLFFPNEWLNDYKYITIVLMILFFICINPKIINFFLRRLGRLMKKDDLEVPMSYLEMLKVVVLFIGNWMIVGVGFFILVRSIYPEVLMNQLLFTGGIYGLSAIIGILAFFAPSGLGVREGIIVAGLSLIMPTEYAVIISVISRLWATIAELILILIAFLQTRIKKRIIKV